MLSKNRIPLEYELVRKLFASKIACCRFKVVIVCLPYHWRPGRMTHPEEQPLPVKASSFKHSPVSVVVYPLSQFSKLSGIVWLTKTCFNDLIKRCSSLCTFKTIVVYSPETVLRPESWFGKSLFKTLISHYIRHSSFTMKFIIAIQQEIISDRESTIWPPPLTTQMQNWKYNASRDAAHVSLSGGQYRVQVVGCLRSCLHIVP